MAWKAACLPRGQDRHRDRRAVPETSWDVQRTAARRRNRLSPDWSYRILTIRRPRIVENSRAVARDVPNPRTHKPLFRVATCSSFGQLKTTQTMSACWIYTVASPNRHISASHTNSDPSGLGVYGKWVLRGRQSPHSLQSRRRTGRQGWSAASATSSGMAPSGRCRRARLVDLAPSVTSARYHAPGLSRLFVRKMMPRGVPRALRAVRVTGSMLPSRCKQSGRACLKAISDVFGKARISRTSPPRIGCRALPFWTKHNVLIGERQSSSSRSRGLAKEKGSLPRLGRCRPPRVDQVQAVVTSA